jgi:hypothetical protein
MSKIVLSGLVVKFGNTFEIVLKALCSSITNTTDIGKSYMFY